ncbi:lipopolysaccharide/colanic/teichoic acid biosynthesis glycosyltransferase [Dokdonia sp. Hel_I_63]|uniref:sugar transferase n=1 Tax=Dokdonia sp. Hel_I_63 TaxID=1249996 RepID=UPI00119B5349|nr:sugar transferase [Dokdonia sp. Hel_I_63]TVZ23008.1 lipopolysaccharide/colanic/teichoic acid biosynthesis glycosyltransferase [Dokdonia sp. Hel_I_63]
MYKNVVKPILDLLFALLFLSIASPIFVFVSILLAITNKGTPFFLQNRPGKNGKIFKIIKFKTMNDRADSSGNLLSDKERLSPLGLFIRKISLDEIPQLINVLKGDMSLVGPRPLLPQYLKLYSVEQSKRHIVKPGITGWAQVNGRNNITWTRKFELDVFYVKNLSFILDIKVLYKTFLKVILREDINKDGAITTVRFNGKN